MSCPDVAVAVAAFIYILAFCPPLTAIAMSVLGEDRGLLALVLGSDPTTRGRADPGYCSLGNEFPFGPKAQGHAARGLLV